MECSKQEAALSFFQGRPAEYQLYLQLEAVLLQRFPESAVQVKKTQISFTNRHLYACISLPARRKTSFPCLLLTFGLPYRLDSPRILQAVEPYPNRWTHHVILRDVLELDEELLGWVQEAYDFSNSKR